MEYHDPIRHLDSLRQTLAQDKKPIGFFLSAGCPLSIELPKDKWPLIPDIKNLTNHISKELSSGNQEKSKYDFLIHEIKKAKLNHENLEDILSFIRGLKQVAHGNNVRGFSETDLISLEKNVCKKISEKLDVHLPNQQTPYHNLSQWINSIDRDLPIEIFTTNYDLLMEEALEDISVPYFDGFVGSRKPFFDLRAIEENLIPKHWTRLWKIHGSINWFQTKDKYVYRSTDINREESHLIYPSHLKYEQSRKMPYLALIDQLNRFIRKKSSILIISGYSFSDEHLNDTIINALKANPTAMVLALMFGEYSNEENESYPFAYELAKKRHNLNIWTNDIAIIGTTLGTWKLFKEPEDKSLLKFIDKPNSEDSSKPESLNIKMGDFAIFSEFLKSLIGTENLIDNE